MLVHDDSDLNAITLESKRLCLIPISLDYSQDIFREFTHDITRYMIPSPPKNIEQVISFINISKKGMSESSDLVLVITRKVDNAFLGVCGLHEQSNPSEPEIGIWLKKSAHHQHYGREAITLLIEWAKHNIISRHLIYPVDRDNIPSRKIAEFIGGKIIRENAKIDTSGIVLNKVTYKITLP